ncbi:50S ribosomal protein L11 [Candidatus Pacearchaeota archaeon]|nr:50S ribosomal protein L11 [Candidatus Pacearchaeota archaeon]
MPKIKLIIEGGAMKPGPAVAQALGPLGINMGKVMAEVNAATSGFKGMNVPVEIDVDAKSKTFTITVSSPSVAEMLKKESGLTKGSGSPLEVKVANISFEQIVSVAKGKHASLLAKTLRSSIKLVVGTCVSLGIMIDSKEAKQVEKDIDAGIYDKEIQQERTETPDAKKKELAAFFVQRKSMQDKKAKAAEEAKAVEEAAKVAAAAAAPAAAAAGTPAAPGAVPAAAATAKKEEKPAAKKK